MKYFTRVIVILCVVITFTICYNVSIRGDIWNTYTEPEDVARCRYRDWRYLYQPNEIWRYVTGAFCYNYSQPERLNFRHELALAFLNGLPFYVTLIDEEPVFFDYLNETYVNLLRPSFVNERFLNLWKECCELAVLCCEQELTVENTTPDEEYVCSALWDGWDCWPRTRANETVFRDCPAHIYTSEEIVCTLQSEKYCLEQDWNHSTNYATCSTAPIFRRRHSFHVLVLQISSALTFPAILIFFIFMRNQKGLRHVLHRNLLIAVVLKNIFTILSKELIILDALRSTTESNNVMENNTVGCRILSFTDTVATTAVFTSMFLVGLYLHKTIARAFSSDMNIYLVYGITFVGSVVPPLIWAIVMAATGQEYCWVVDTVGYHWITDVYKYAILVINLALLVDIVRVIWMRRASFNSKQTKSAVKATIVMVPLFGLPLLITSQRSFIDQESCLSGDIYYFIAYSVEALQGIIVALLFCYLNREVHTVIKKSYRKFAIYMNNRFGMNLRIPSQVKTTGVTNLRSSGIDPNQIQKSSVGDDKQKVLQKWLSANKVKPALDSDT